MDKDPDPIHPSPYLSHRGCLLLPYPSLLRLLSLHPSLSLGAPLLLTSGPASAVATLRLLPPLTNPLAASQVALVGLDVALSLWGAHCGLGGHGASIAPVLPHHQRHGAPAPRIRVAVAGLVPPQPLQPQALPTPPATACPSLDCRAQQEQRQCDNALPLLPPPHPAACTASPCAAPLFSRLLHGLLLAPGQLVALPLLGLEAGGETLAGWVLVRAWAEGGRAAAPAARTPWKRCSACMARPQRAHLGRLLCHRRHYPSSPVMSAAARPTTLAPPTTSTQRLFS